MLFVMQWRGGCDVVLLSIIDFFIGLTEHGTGNPATAELHASSHMAARWELMID
jgi:hypothetical protein